MSAMDNKFMERGLSLFTDGFCRDAPAGSLYSRRIGTVPENTSGRGAEKGFSLIEVLIITAIIGILTTIAVMNFGGIIDSYKVRGAASQLYSEMQMARLRAIKEGKEFAVEFITSNTTTYCIKRKAGSTWDAGCDVGGNDTVDEIIKTVDLASDYSGLTLDPTNLGNSNETANERTEFNPNGTASSGRVVISKGARVQSLCINSSTGNIRIVNGSTCS